MVPIVGYILFLFLWDAKIMLLLSLGSNLIEANPIPLGSLPPLSFSAMIYNIMPEVAFSLMQVVKSVCFGA